MNQGKDTNHLLNALGYGLNNVNMMLHIQYAVLPDKIWNE